MGASVGDNVVTAIAFPEYELSGHAESQAENEAMLEARWQRILARTDLTPQQRLIAEKQYAQFRGSRIDPVEGNGKIFADEYKAQVSGVTSSIVKSLFDEFLPLTLALIGLAAFAIFVRFYPNPK